MKDQGVYMMSNGHNPGETTASDLGLVVYAEGCNPEIGEDWYENGRYICGGDDFAEFIDLGWYQYALKNKCKDFIIEMTDEHMKFRPDLMEKETFET